MDLSTLGFAVGKINARRVQPKKNPSASGNPPTTLAIPIAIRCRVRKISRNCIFKS